MKKLNDLFYSFLQVAASTQKLGINLIRISILIIFVWIGGLKFWNYEAEGIVPFVANSPFMSFFYTKSAPEYKTYKLRYEEREKSISEAYTEYNEIRELLEKVFGKEVEHPIDMVIRNVERAAAPEGNTATKKSVMLEYYVEDDNNGE